MNVGNFGSYVVDLALSIVNNIETIFASLFANLAANASEVGKAIRQALTGQDITADFKFDFSSITNKLPKIDLIDLEKSGATQELESRLSDLGLKIGREFTEALFPGFNDLLSGDGAQKVEVVNGDDETELSRSVGKLSNKIERIAIADLFTKIQDAILGNTSDDERQVRAAEKTADRAQSIAEATRRTADAVENLVAGGGTAVFAA